MYGVSSILILYFPTTGLTKYQSRSTYNVCLRQNITKERPITSNLIRTTVLLLLCIQLVTDVFDIKNVSRVRDVHVARECIQRKWRQLMSWISLTQHYNIPNAYQSPPAYLQCLARARCQTVRMGLD